ncbi:hypothetical protein TNCV_695431 [Trichonephila clavipes]|nr:hypothetical protein TNCV_695431 [Trichonephila clavipes]
MDIHFKVYFNHPQTTEIIPRYPEKQSIDPSPLREDMIGSEFLVLIKSTNETGVQSLSIVLPLVLPFNGQDTNDMESRATMAVHIVREMLSRTWLEISYILDVLLANSSESLSFNLMSSLEYKLEQDSSPPSDSFSEISRNKLATASEPKSCLLNTKLKE